MLKHAREKHGELEVVFKERGFFHCNINKVACEQVLCNHNGDTELSSKKYLVLSKE